MTIPPQLQLLLTGALFATGGAMLKSCTMPPAQVAGLRAAIAAAVIFLLLPEARRLPSWRVLLLLPCFFGATFLFVLSNGLTTAASAIFLQCTYPVWVTVLGPLLLRERPQGRDLVTLLCMGAGMYLFFLAPSEASTTAPDPTLGNWIALGAGLSFGLLMIGFRWLAVVGSGEQCAVVAWGNLLTLPLALVLSPLLGQAWTPGSAHDWSMLAVLGVFQVGLAYSMLVRAIPHVPAVRASLLLMVEPALNPLFAFIVHGEAPHWLVVVGGTLIVSSVAVVGAVAEVRKRRSTVIS